MSTLQHISNSGLESPFYVSPSLFLFLTVSTLKHISNSVLESFESAGGSASTGLFLHWVGWEERREAVFRGLDPYIGKVTCSI